MLSLLRLIERKLKLDEINSTSAAFYEAQTSHFLKYCHFLFRYKHFSTSHANKSSYAIIPPPGKVLQFNNDLMGHIHFLHTCRELVHHETHKEFKNSKHQNHLF